MTPDPRAAAMTERDLIEHVRRTCPICGVLFVLTSKHPNVRTCSPQCGAVIRGREQSAKPRVPVIDRVLAKVQEDANGCWLFMGARLRLGYGVIGLTGGKTRVAHRVTYEYFVADIPLGLQLDHLCRVTSCVNPWHLEPVTQQVNISRQTIVNLRALANGAKTHCLRGHPFDAVNTYVSKRGRQCKACNRARAQGRRV